MRALVTGASGFVGGHLLCLLQMEGLEIFTHGPERATLGKHFDSPVEDIIRLQEVIREVQPDYIFHLAGVSSGPDYALFYKVNTLYAANLLRALELEGFTSCPVLLTGSAAEYGMVAQEEMPITEKTICQPYHHYGASKLAQTHLGRILADAGRRIVLVRPFNIIGPGMGSHLSVQSFALQIAQIMRGEHPPLLEVGNLSSSRDFVDVSEVVDIYWKLMRTPAAFGRVVNICSGKPIKMSEILSRLVHLSGREIEIRVAAERFKALDVPVSYGDPSLLKALIGTLPSRPLDDTLRDILEFLLGAKDG